MGEKEQRYYVDKRGKGGKSLKLGKVTSHQEKSM